MKKFIKIGVILLISFTSLVNAELIYKDFKTSLEWQDKDESPKLSWYQALEYCNTLDLNGDGWRLPNINELHTIISYSTVNPSIIDGFTYIENNYYWSSTTKYNNTQNALAISFSNASMSYFNKETALNTIRCVREIR